MKYNIFKSVPKHKPSVLSVSSLIVLTLYSLVIVGVFVWAICFSLTDYNDIVVPGASVNYLAAPSFCFENYAKVFENFHVTTSNGTEVGVVGMFLNSLLFAIGSALAGAFCPCLVAYAATKFNYKFSKVLDVIVIVTMALPVVGSLPSMIRVVETLNLTNNFLGLWIMAFNFSTMFYFIYKAAFKQVPDSLSEAAKIDGASQFRIFFGINFPLIKINFLSVFLLLFVRYWNNYTTPLAFARDLPTISYGFYWGVVSNNNGVMYQEVIKIAGGIILIIPMLIMFIFANKFLMGNLTMGGEKE